MALKRTLTCFFVLVACVLLVLPSSAARLPVPEHSENFTFNTPTRRIIPFVPGRLDKTIVSPYGTQKKAGLSEAEREKERLKYKKSFLTEKLNAKGYTYSAESFVNAARSDDIEALLIFIESGMDVNIRNPFGQTALMAAAGTNSLKSAQVLLDKKANPNLLSGPKRESALVNAVKRNYGGMVNMLLDAGADVDILSRDNWTPLFYAIADNDLTLASLLMKLGANPNHADRFGLTPLMVCAQKGYFEMSVILLKFGANHTARDYTGNSALLLTVLGHHYSIARLLLEKGADPNGRSSHGWSLLDIALDRGYLDMANLLLAYGAQRPETLGQ